MLWLMRKLIVLTCLVLLLMLAYHFFAPEKDLVTGSPLRLRIKTQALLTVTSQEASKSFEKIIKAKQGERLPLLQTEAQTMWRKLQDTYKKNAFLNFVNELKTMTASLLGTAREQINIIAAGDEAKIRASIPTSLQDFSRALKAWVDINQRRLHALSGVDTDDAETKARDELINLHEQLKSASEELEKRVAAVKDVRKGFVPASYRGDQPVRVKSQSTSENAQGVSESDNIAPAPKVVLDTFRERYLNKELRKTPYFFKDLKILKSASGLVPGLYCISFSAEVYHNQNNRRWEKSPVILNVLAKVGQDGVMSTYENFAKNPWEYPVNGACVKPLWGVHDYVWEKVCPYPCMGK